MHFLPKLAINYDFRHKIVLNYYATGWINRTRGGARISAMPMRLRSEGACTALPGLQVGELVTAPRNGPNRCITITTNTNMRMLLIMKVMQHSTLLLSRHR